MEREFSSPVRLRTNQRPFSRVWGSPVSERLHRGVYLLPNHSTPLSAAVNGLYRQPGCSFLWPFPASRARFLLEPALCGRGCSLREGSACSPVIVSVSMAPQVGDSQVLEWTGRLMPWKGEVSSLFSAQLNIVSKDVLPISPILGQEGRSVFSFVLFSWLHFKWRDEEDPTVRKYYTHN